MAFLRADKVTQLNGVTVKEYLLTEHNPRRITMPSRRVLPLIGVTIHNTDAIKVNGTTMAEQYTRATYNGNMGTVRVHFYVDDKEAWQNLPLDRQGWHAADGSGNGNTRTIAIECIGDSAKAEDNAARLAAYLLSSNGLDTSALYTHTFWLNVRDGKGAELSKDERCVLPHPYKVCPLYIIPHWAVFVEKVRGYMAPAPSPVQEGAFGTRYNIVVGVYSVEENAKKRLEEVKKVYPDAFIKKTIVKNG